MSLPMPTDHRLFELNTAYLTGVVHALARGAVDAHPPQPTAPREFDRYRHISKGMFVDQFRAGLLYGRRL